MLNQSVVMIFVLCLGTKMCLCFLSFLSFLEFRSSMLYVIRFFVRLKLLYEETWKSSILSSIIICLYIQSDYMSLLNRIYASPLYSLLNLDAAQPRPGYEYSSILVCITFYYVEASYTSIIPQRCSKC